MPPNGATKQPLCNYARPPMPEYYRTQLESNSWQGTGLATTALEWSAHAASRAGKARASPKTVPRYLASKRYLPASGLAVSELGGDDRFCSRGICRGPRSNVGHPDEHNHLQFLSHHYENVVLLNVKPVLKASTPEIRMYSSF